MSIKNYTRRHQIQVHTFSQPVFAIELLSQWMELDFWLHFFYWNESKFFQMNFFLITECREISRTTKRTSKRVLLSWVMTNANRNDAVRSVRNHARWWEWENCALKSHPTRKSPACPKNCASVAVFVSKWVWFWVA